MRIWKKIDDYDYDYQVSSDGLVRNNTLEHYLTPFETDTGYLRVMLRRNKVPCNKYIHRLVAESFIPNPLNLPQVNHKDECKSNNDVSNLEWCTAKENSHYSEVWKNPVKVTSKRVLQYTLDDILIGEYKSTGEAARLTGISQSQICRCCNKKFKQTNGFIFKYGKELTVDE